MLHELVIYQKTYDLLLYATQAQGLRSAICSG